MGGYRLRWCSARTTRGMMIAIAKDVRTNSLATLIICPTYRKSKGLRPSSGLLGTVRQKRTGLIQRSSLYYLQL